MIDPTQLAIAVGSFILLLVFGVGGFLALLWILWNLIFPAIDRIK